MLKKRVNRYVDRVIRYLPLLDRKKARTIITSTIYERLYDITGGTKPTAFDLRMVFNEMGDPATLAYTYYDDFHRPLWKRLDIGKFLHRFITLLTIVALVLVTFGLAELIIGVGSMRIFAVGLVLSVIVVFYQMLIQPIQGGIGELKKLFD